MMILLLLLFCVLTTGTAEDTYRKALTVDEHAVKVDIVDAGGADEFAGMREHWIRNAEGFVLVYDVTQRASFEHARQLHAQMLDVKHINKVPMVLVGNKCDCDAVERQVSREEGEQLGMRSVSIFSRSTAVVIRFILNNIVESTG